MTGPDDDNAEIHELFGSPDPDASPYDDWDDLDAAWREADQHAAEVLRSAVPEALDSEPPMHEVARVADELRGLIERGTEDGRYFATAAGWDEVPSIDLMLWIGAAGSTISPLNDPGTDAEQQAAVISMEHADWLALIGGLVRRGVGAEMSADLLVADLAAMPEVEGDESPDPSEYELAVEVLVPLWQALGAIDSERRLTPLGWWGLPRVLYLVWAMSDDDADHDIPPDLAERLSGQERVAYDAWRSVLLAHERGLEPDQADLTAMTNLFGTALDFAALDIADHCDCEPLLDQMERLADDTGAGAAVYLLARAAEARREGPAYLSLLERAVAADSSLADAVADLAEVRAIQGDAAEAHRLFGLAEVDPSYPARAALAPFLEPPRGEVGRNQPCPCGSGKKYKVCHGRTARHPLPDRAQWLLVKLKTFAQRGINRDELLDWAELTSGVDRDEREAVVNAMTDASTWEFALFDGSILADFVAMYADLVPDDELGLLRSWQDWPRQLVEITRTHLTGVVGTDLVADEPVELRDRTLARGLEPGDLILGRFLDPGDGTLRPWDDPLSIPRMWRSRVLSALRDSTDASELAAMLAPPAALPELRTTSGEELLLCRARYDLSNLDEAWGALSEMLEDHDGALHQLGEGGVVEGTVTVEAERLVLEALSLPRLRSLQALLAEVSPEARLVDESSRPAADLLAEGPPTEGAAEPIEIDEADRDAIARQLEQRWLSDHVPALGGRTPHEAAADPNLRKELVALLRDFEVMGRGSRQQITMDVDRLRAELGL